MISVSRQNKNNYVMGFFLYSFQYTCMYMYTCTYLGMPPSGGQYSVMGRHQDPRSSMFGSSINLNGKEKEQFFYPSFNMFKKNQMHLCSPNIIYISIRDITVTTGKLMYRGR